MFCCCRYEVAAPVAWVATPPSSFLGLETLGTGNPNVTVVGGGSLRLDYGRERAGWFEFTSPDLGEQVCMGTGMCGELST